MNKKQVAVEDLGSACTWSSWTAPGSARRSISRVSRSQPTTRSSRSRSIARSVFVDPEREAWTPDPRRAGCSSRCAGSVVYREVTPVEKEVVVAREIYKSCEEAIQQSLDNLRFHGEIDSQKLTGAVTSMTESIQRNPDAMMLLNTLRQKGGYELGRAMDTSILMITFGRFLQFPKDRLEVLGLAGHAARRGQDEASRRDPARNRTC